eukprot:TRINITY_DN48818_c0_g1_i1.p1 TRINITY_DN48818_c0_g1~~TRINITY_DN48818_c0_g1_i1.p1  ORF type:complete len:457 (-),score=62.09 TRINITY_DN48818_c0_g1_i1:291-1661(-)
MSFVGGGGHIGEAERLNDVQGTSRTLWVADLEPWMDEAYLFQTFSVGGAVSNLKIVRDKDRGCALYAFVEFASREDAAALFDRQSIEPFTDQHGYRFKLNWALYGLCGSSQPGCRPTASDVSIYVGGLGQDVREWQLHKPFADKYKSVISTKIVFDSTTGVSKGFGFVRFRDPAEAERAIVETQGLLINSRPVKVRPSITKKPEVGGVAPSRPITDTPWASVPSLQLSTDGCVVNVPNVNPRISEAELAQHFSVFGTVHRATILSGQSGGALIEFRDRASAELAACHCGIPNGGGGWDAVGATSPMVTNMIASQAQCHWETHLQSDKVDESAVLKAAGAWSCGLSSGRALPPALATFQVLMQYPGFVSLFEAELGKIQREGGSAASVIPSDSIDRAASSRLVPSWLLKDQPELFSGGSCAKQMNEDHSPTLGDARLCSGRSGPVLWLPEASCARSG